MTTQALFLAAMLTAAGPSPATPAAFQFKDAATYENRPVLQYRAIEFRDVPVRPLGNDLKFGKGTLYGLVPVGPRPETALTIVWRPKAPGGPELWLDGNGDGKLTADERHAMSGRELEIAATITTEVDPKRQTVQCARSCSGVRRWAKGCATPSADTCRAASTWAGRSTRR